MISPGQAECSPEATAGIDWKRVAEPQPDEYDSEITLRLARAQGYVRREVGDGPAFFDRAIALHPDPAFFGAECVPARDDHPSMSAACEMVRLWPAGFRQCQRLIESVSGFVHQRWGPSVYGSMCGPGSRGFGTINSTVNSSIGLAEALVHEMAHHKLRALGVQVEHAIRLIRNPAEQRFRSPIRYDCLRPMPAVLHAQYSYTYITALDIEVIRSSTDKAVIGGIAGTSLARYIPKLEFGLEVIRLNVGTDSDGADFLAGLYDWSARLLANGHALLQGLGIAPYPFVHPL